MVLTFEWDEEKSKRNVERRGIPFEEAKTIFKALFAFSIGHPKAQLR